MIQRKVRTQSYLRGRVQAPVAFSRHDGAPPGSVGREEGEQLGGFEGGRPQKVVHRRIEMQLVELDEARFGMNGGEKGGEGSVGGRREGLFDESNALINLRNARDQQDVISALPR